MIVNTMKKTLIYTFLIPGLIMGLLIAWQFNTKVPIESNFPSDEVSVREELIKNFLDEQSYLQSRIVALRKQIDDIQGELEDQTKIVNLELLENLKKEIGLTEVTDTGLTILLDDSSLVNRAGIEANDSNLIQASDIRDVINILNAANADAISINGQRIIATSPITSVGTTILVNNSHIAPPFNISAVGDIEIMLQRLLDKNLLPSLYEKRRKSGIVFEITKNTRISVPIYNGDLKNNYLNLVTEG